MANKRVKDLPNANTLADADELIIDSSSAGTRRISYSELKTEVAGDYVAAPSTYKVATLASDNKLDPSQVPDTLSQGLNFVGNANSAGDLTSTTQGDFYVIQTAFGVYSVGDQAVYDGSSYVRVTDGTKQIGEGGTGATTLSDAQINLEIGNIGTRPQDIPLNGFLNSGAYLDFDAFYQTGTWTPTLSFGGGSTGVSYAIQEGYYTRVGNQVTVHGIITLSSKGTDTGNARIGGLPYTVSNTVTSYQSATIGYVINMASLTSPITGLFDDASATIALRDWDASDSVNIDNTNFNSNSSIRFSGTYQIA